ncbi:glucosamine-6-phosphate deaminase [Paucisalibacillus globulus]|uniref:glucosamine-6-phosphate deaminase n=1 Tax=Paucisalibacillus globulus TaxID=351095 RepID=UPI0004014F1F|nr:glucosamine-6-phosphate deaminase [Paucisalibacillus globulus]
MEIIRVKDYAAMSEAASTFLIERINRLDNPKLGLATGSTPEGLYKNIIEKHKQGDVSFKNVKSFNLDEYVGLEKNDPNSYYFFMKDKLFDHVDISLDNVRVPNGVAADLQQECQDHEEAIKAAGGIDVQLLGIGANGHIGFNEPGTPFTSKTQVVNLDESTIQANSRFFNTIEEVPTQAISMGIDTIMNSKEILLLISGESKAEALAKLVSGEVTEEVPASVLNNHPNVTVIADEAAFSVVDGK